MVRPLFHDRRDAGRRLAEHLASLRGQADVIVLALPRGGVPVAYEVATALRAPMEVFVVRKLGVPGYPELAMGAIATGGVRVLNQQVLGDMGVSQQALDRITAPMYRPIRRILPDFGGLDFSPIVVLSVTSMASFSTASL